ncbi:MAG: ABC transporter permease subunit [Planctomycetota bacterium]|nr:ABC transporter permease subunit [Planctomycetota bacterium]MDA1139693.1 ABC transporter permease subunit [Planctomycetota bacterium]
MKALLNPSTCLILIFVISALVIGLWGNLWHLFKKEVSSILLSPILYIFTAVFLVLTGIFFFEGVSRGPSPQATLRPLLSTVSFVLLFFTPAITMRLFSEEARSGTIETLMTAPVTELQVVLSKFYAGLTFFIIMLLPTISYALILNSMATGGIDFGPILSGYLGLLLMGATFIALGTFISSLTKNQIIAFVITVTSMLVLWIIGFFAQNKNEALFQVMAYLGIPDHVDDFVKGIVDSRNVVYFLSTTVFFLFMTVRSLESRKWR